MSKKRRGTTSNGEAPRKHAPDTPESIGPPSPAREIPTGMPGQRSGDSETGETTDVVAEKWNEGAPVPVEADHRYWRGSPPGSKQRQHKRRQ